jgi:hypothetical protein
MIVYLFLYYNYVSIYAGHLPSHPKCMFVLFRQLCRVALAVSRWLHTTAAHDPMSGHVGFTLGQIFPENLGFPCQFSFQQQLHIH